MLVCGVSMGRVLFGLIFVVLGAFGITLLGYNLQRPVPDSKPSVTRDELRFSGDRAHRLAVEFAAAFPYRHSGTANSKAAAERLARFFAGLGFKVEMDNYKRFLYGKRVELHNIQAVLPGRTSETVVVVAHTDQARTTVQGADNDASGIGIMMHLAEIFAGRDNYRTLVFLAGDGEEYGMLGARQFLSVYPPERIVASVSLDNVGRFNGTGLHIAAAGQRRGYTDLWLAMLVQQAAEKVGVWRPTFPDPLRQVVERAVPFSFTDQGPFLCYGIPAFDLGVTSPSWPYYHTPEDTVDKISPVPMAQAGLLTEAVISELEARQQLPPGQQTYLYFDRGPGRYLPPWALRLVMLCLLLPLFYSARKSWRETRLSSDEVLSGLARLGLNALPLLGGLLTLYILVAANVIPRFSLYPAPPKDPVLFQPSYPGAVILLVVIISLTWISRRFAAALPSTGATACRPVVLVLLSLLSLSVFLVNGFALIFLLPCNYFWLFIRERKGSAGGIVNILLLLAGGSVLFALLYVFSILIYVGWYMWWYFLQMLAFRMIPFYAALAGIIAISSGLTLVSGVPAPTTRTTRGLRVRPTGLQTHNV